MKLVKTTQHLWMQHAYIVKLNKFVVIYHLT
jgi:hypothetical protein